MADVALISVIATGTVGVLGAAGAVYTQRQSQRVSLKIDEEGRRDAWRDDLRSVLDNAAQVALGVNVPNPPGTTMSKLAFQTGQARAELDKHLGRIGVRLGPKSEVYKQYEQIRHATNDLANAFAEFPPGATGEYLNPERALEWTDAVKAAALTMSKAVDDIEHGVSAFLQAAAAITRMD